MLSELTRRSLPRKFALFGECRLVVAILEMLLNATAADVSSGIVHAALVHVRVIGLLTFARSLRCGWRAYAFLEAFLLLSWYCASRVARCNLTTLQAAPISTGARYN